MDRGQIFSLIYLSDIEDIIKNICPEFMKKFFAFFLTALMLLSAVSGAPLTALAEELSAGVSLSSAKATLSDVFNPDFLNRDDGEEPSVNETAETPQNNSPLEVNEPQTAEYISKRSLITASFTAGDYEYDIDGSSVLIKKYTGTAETLNVPGTIEGKTVTAISDYAFEGTAVVNVTLPASIKTLGYNSFRDCRFLKSITLNSGLTTIEDNSFYGCRSLLEITIPDSVITLDSSSFRDCISLTTVNIGSGLRELSESLFYNCTSLISVKMGSKINKINNYCFAACASLELIDLQTCPITEIGYCAFENCYSITTVKLPDSMRVIGDAVFEDCEALENITLNAGLTTIGNSAFSHCISLPSVIIPDSVTSIGQSVFEYCLSIIELTVGNGLREIPNYALYECSSLRTLNMGSKVASIGESAFRSCLSLEKIKLQGSPLNTIGYNAFANCESITQIILPNSMKIIDAYAFADCIALESIILNSGLTTIREGAFRKCQSLKSFTIPNTVTLLGSDGGYGYVFEDCTSLTNVIIGSGLREIPSSAFSGCYSINTVDIGSKTNIIGDYAFSECRSLSSINLSNITTLGYYSFGGCSGLISAELGDSLSSIPDEAFDGCISLRLVKFGSGLTEIGRYAFENCLSLDNIDLSKCPSVSVDSTAFYNCKGENKVSNDSFAKIAALTRPSIEMPDDNRDNRQPPENKKAQNDVITYSVPKIPMLSGEFTSGDYEYDNIDGFAVITAYNGSDTDITVPGMLDGLVVNSIGESAFEAMALTSVVLPSSIKNIGNRAFAECSGLEQVSLNEGLLTIGDAAFYKCGALSEITIPDSVVSLNLNWWWDNGTFAHCISLKKATIGASLREIPESAFYGCSALSEVVMGKNVNLIGEYAFFDCLSLETIDLSVSSLAIIGYSAFKNCKGISEISFPSSMRVLESYAFENCSALTKVTVNQGLNIIKRGAFYECISLPSISLPDSVKVLEDSVFSGCISLSSATIGSSLKGIPSNTFNECSSLTSINITGKVKAIGEYAFNGCKSLEEVNIKDSQLIKIEDYAFYDCNYISSIILPPTVKVIGHSAFNGCTGLTSITLNEGLAAIKGYAFNNCKSLESINIPDTVAAFGMFFGDSIFNDCISLQSVTLGSRIKNIPNYCFNNCSSLSEIIIKGKINSVGYRAFDECKSLVSIDLSGAGVLREYAFSGCKSLESVNLGDSLKVIEYAAFADCISLRSVHFGSSLKKIGDSAFKSCTNLRTVNLSKSPVYLVDNYAFYECKNLNELILPQTLQSIGNGAFSNCTNLRSITWGNGLIEIGYESFYGAALETLTLPSSLQSLGQWAFVNCSKLMNATVPESIWVYGNGAFNACHDSFVLIGVPGSAAEQFATDMGYLFEPIGDHITLDANATTNTAKIKITGAANAGKAVKIYDGNTLLGTFTAGKNRRYGGEVTLTGNGLHVLRAETDAEGGNKISAEKAVNYEVSAPGLKSFIMHHDGQSINLVTDEGIRQTLIFRGGRPFTFEVKADNSEQIKIMYIRSERNGVSKYIRAYYDAAKETWLATGYFDADDTSYVPGKISIAYDVDYQQPPVDLSAAFTSEQINAVKENLSPEWKNATIETIKESENEKEYKITLDDAKQSVVTYSFARQTGGTKTEAQLLAEGFIKLATADGGFIYARLTLTKSLIKSLTFDGSTASVEYYNLESGITDIVSFSGDMATSIPSMMPALAGPAWGALSTGYSTVQRYGDYEQIGRNIDNSGWSDADKSLAHSQLDSVFAANVATNVGIFAIATIAGIGVTAIGPIIAISLGAMAAGYLANLFFDHLYMGINNGSYRIAIDPSGYVYEAVPENRLQGVKTTVYFKETLDSAAVLWDASEYDQDNPLITDHEGRYAWDVPEGWWQVKFELDGYDTAYSEWLPVPPPQTEVNMGLKTNAAPSLVRVKAFESGVELEFSKYMDVAEIINNNWITITMGGNTVAGELTFPDAALNPVSSRSYAKTVRFVPFENISGTVNVSVSADIKSYAGAKMSEAYASDIAVQLEPQEIVAENIELIYGDSGNIAVTVNPAQAAAGLKIKAVSSDTAIAEVASEATLDENGKANIAVTSKLPGFVSVSLSLEGTSLKKQATVSIGMNTVTEYTVTVVKGTAAKTAYTAGETVVITADAPAAGKVFDKWITSDGVSFAAPGNISTSFIMPEKNVTVTATYKDHVHMGGHATCTEKAVCEICFNSYGSLASHTWISSTCTSAKTCSVCSITEGGVLGHTWIAATCTSAKKCSVCNVTEGSALGHTWIAATCTSAKKCLICNITEGSPLAHTWIAATCTNPKTCSVCTQEEGKALGHKMGEWTVKSAATTEKEGLETRACKNSGCKYTESRAIPKLSGAKIEITDKTSFVIDETNICFAEIINAADLLKKFKAGSIKLTDKDGNEISGSSPVGSGAVVSLVEGGETLDSYTMILLGDLDGNGEITAVDARIALRASASLDKLNEWQTLAANVNNDGDLTAVDAREILRASASLQDPKAWLEKRKEG